MKWLIIGAVFLMSLALAASQHLSAVSADPESKTYAYVIGTGFLCGLDPTACPAVAGAKNGDTIEITGEGTFSIHEKSATGGGTFVHKDSEGNVIGSGTWEAMELISFHSYGSGSVQGLPPELQGGKALMRVHLTADGGGPEFDGILWVDCLLGDKIPAGAAEGVRLDVPGIINFNKEVSGFTVYVLE